MVSGFFAHIGQKGLSCKAKLIESIIQVENVIQNFVLKYSKRGFDCELTWNKVYSFPVNFRNVKHIYDSILWGRFLQDRLEKQIENGFNWYFTYWCKGPTYIDITS